MKGSRFLREHALPGGNVYYRKYRTDSVASNVNGAFGVIDPATGLVETVQATNDRSLIDQESYGLGLQLTLPGQAAGMKNQLTLGASDDFGRARFTQYSQDAQFTPRRDTTGIDDFALSTDADTRSRYSGVFAADTLHLHPRWTLTVSGRYNRADVTISDRTGNAPLLNGDHVFSRFNPAVGLNFNPTEHLTAYASYNAGMRAPTAIELTCSAC